jgi:hypothetical protein
MVHYALMYDLRGINLDKKIRLERYEKLHIINYENFENLRHFQVMGIL